jgi:hypothetical protein
MHGLVYSDQNRDCGVSPRLVLDDCNTGQFLVNFDFYQNRWILKLSCSFGLVGSFEPVGLYRCFVQKLPPEQYVVTNFLYQ